ncbi:MAG: hypothetical protein H6839_05085 [Planctomycetes bacterium]|nr:hypothetical protein [Planctomycetota bacterium]
MVRRLPTTILRLGALVLAALPLVLVDAHPVTALARGKAELSWAVDDALYLHYALDSQTEQGEEGDPKPNLQYVHLMGYEIAADGQMPEVSKPWEFEEILFQLASFVPAATMREGDTWQHDWNFDRVSGTQALSATSAYTFTELAEYEKHECAHITATHKLTTVQPDTVLPRWTKLELTTDTYFNSESGCALGVKLVLRGAKMELGAKPEDPTVSKNYAWDAEWKLSRSVDSTDTDYLKKKVDIAIFNGVERLWAQRNKEGTWPYGTNVRGGTALSLLALLMCGEDPGDARMTESFRLMQEAELNTTYDVAISIMAYEAKYISKSEREAFLKGGDAGKQERKLSQQDMKEVQRLTDWLIDNRNEPNVMWNYKRDEDSPARYDFSVTQYALLGLGSAMRCGVVIPTGYIRKLVEFVRSLQAPDGPEFKRVVDYKPGKKKNGKKGEDRVTLSTKNVKARGWAYTYAATYIPDTGATSAYGSMTCAGITTLIAGLDIAANMEDKARIKEFDNNAQYKNWERDTQQALDWGMSWMEYWFSITRNPNHARAWYYYYLYGLERICMLSDVRYLGTHDWYFEGASALITLQDDNGGWGGAVDTAFALLFLKRGTVRTNKPVYTGGPKE